MAEILIIAPSGEEGDRLQRELDPLACRVRRAAPGLGSLLAVIANSPDIIIAIQRLPQTDAVETLKFIREFDTEMPVIIVSADRRRENVLEAKKYAATEFLAQPVDYGELRRRIGDHIQALRDLGEISEDETVVVDRGLVKRVRTLDVSQLECGHRLAEPVTVDHTVYMSAESVLGRSHIARLAELGVGAVKVYSEPPESKLPRRPRVEFRGERLPLELGRGLIERHQFVTVKPAAGLGEYLGAIAEIGPGSFTVELQADQEPPRLGPDARVGVRYGMRGGRIEFETVAEQPEADAPWRLELKFPETLYRRQMRRHMRVDADAPITVKIEDDPDMRRISGRIKDVSVNAVGLLTDEPLKKGMPLLMNFRLGRGVEFRNLEGTVVRADPSRLNPERRWSCGVVYASLTDVQKDRLVKLILDLWTMKSSTHPAAAPEPRPQARIPPPDAGKA